MKTKQAQKTQLNKYLWFSVTTTFTLERYNKTQYARSVESYNIIENPKHPLVLGISDISKFLKQNKWSMAFASYKRTYSNCTNNPSTSTITGHSKGNYLHHKFLQIWSKGTRLGKLNLVLYCIMLYTVNNLCPITRREHPVLVSRLKREPRDVPPPPPGSFPLSIHDQAAHIGNLNPNLQEDRDIAISVRNSNI